MALNVTFPEGTKTITLKVKASDNIRHLKNLIKKGHGYKRKDQRIIYNSPQSSIELEDNNTLRSYRIVNGDVVSLVRPSDSMFLHIDA